ncbi:hypothetical protein [Kangiella sp. M94]
MSEAEEQILNLVLDDITYGGLFGVSLGAVLGISVGGGLEVGFEGRGRLVMSGANPNI